MSTKLSDELGAAFGDAAKFHQIVDANWPAIDRALRGYEYACRVVDAGFQFGSFDFSIMRQEARAFVAKADGA